MFTTVYFSLDEETSEVTARLFHGDVAKVGEMQKQDGGKDWTFCHSNQYCYCLWS